MATKTQNKSSSSNRSGRINRLAHWMNHNTRFELALGLTFMYLHVIAVTIFHSWVLMWLAPIGVVLIASSVSEMIVNMANDGEL